MSGFSIEAMKVLKNKGLYCWTQQDVDTVTAYLFSRGFQPPRCHGNVTYCKVVDYRVRNSGKFVLPENTMEIDRARFKEPSGTGFMRANKAIKLALRLETGPNAYKSLVLQAIAAFDRGDLGDCREHLLQLAMKVGAANDIGT